MTTSLSEMISTSWNENKATSSETTTPRAAEPDSRQRIDKGFVDRLAEIHAVDYEAVGLGDFGRFEEYLVRQVECWHEQFDGAINVTAAEREIPEIHEVGSWLEDNVPDTHPHTLAHGDCKLDNVIFGFDEPPEIVDIVDWGLSTLATYGSTSAGYSPTGKYG